MKYRSCRSKGKDANIPKGRYAHNIASSSKGTLTQNSKLDQSALIENFELIKLNANKLENERAEMFEEVQAIDVNLAAEAKSNLKFTAELEESRTKVENLKISISELDDEKADFRKDLEMSLTMEIYYMQRLEKLITSADQETSILRKQKLEDEIKDKDERISELRGYLNHLTELKHVTSTPFCINTIRRTLLGLCNFGTCCLCGLTFHDRYKLSLTLFCDHEYHLACAALLKEGKCKVCDVSIHPDLYIELGMTAELPKVIDVPQPKATVEDATHVDESPLNQHGTPAKTVSEADTGNAQQLLMDQLMMSPRKILRRKAAGRKIITEEASIASPEDKEPADKDAGDNEEVESTPVREKRAATKRKSAGTEMGNKKKAKNTESAKKASKKGKNTESVVKRKYNFRRRALDKDLEKADTEQVNLESEEAAVQANSATGPPVTEELVDAPIEEDEEIFEDARNDMASQVAFDKTTVNKAERLKAMIECMKGNDNVSIKNFY